MAKEPSKNSPCRCGSGRKYKKCCLGKTIGDWNYTYHCVAFLDLMGQRQLFEPISGIPTTEEGQARLISVLKKTIGFITEFRKDFDKLLKNMERERKIPKIIPVEHHAEYRRLQRVETHLHTVSDSLIAWCQVHAVDEASVAKAMNGLWSILMGTAGMNLIALAAEHPLRGGIEIDGAIPLKQGDIEIYGPALNRAYDLESKCAGSPRILIGPGVLSFLKSVEADRGDSRLLSHARNVANRCRQLITTDEDGKSILHILGPGARELAREMGGPEGFENHRREILERAYAFVKRSLNDFRANERIGPKYQRLLNYFEKHVPDWYAKN